MLKQVREQKLFVVALLLILSDQLTKIWIKGFQLFGFVHEGMTLESSRNVLGDFLRFSYVENPGMAFGVTFGDGKIFLSLFSILAAGALAWYLHKLRHSNVWVQLGVMLLMSGAIGNLIDRVFYGVIYSESPLFYGKVVDFIDVDCPDFNLFGREITRWWVFNIADACVSCGITLLMLVNAKIPTLKSLNSRQYDLDAQVQISDYSPQWASEFTELQSVLQQSLGSKAISIEHVGSTSVPELSAKPILDVDVVIASMDEFAAVRTSLEALGYVYEGDKGIPQREAFRQADDMVPHGSGHRWLPQHLYVCPENSAALADHRNFRDALLNSSELRDSYAILKRDLAQRFANDREGYTNAKADFIQAALEARNRSESSEDSSSTETSDQSSSI